MTMPVAGNSVVANFLMRFPVLIPVAAAVGIAAVVVPAPTPPPTPTSLVVTQPAPPAPAPVVVKEQPKPIETVCPPVEKTAKLSKNEKKALVQKGCKVKG